MSEINLTPEEKYNRYYDVQELLQKNGISPVDAAVFAFGFLSYYVKDGFYTMEKITEMLTRFQDEVWEHQGALCQARLAKKEKAEGMKCPECGSLFYKPVVKALDSGKLASGHECAKCGYEEIGELIE